MSTHPILKTLSLEEQDLLKEVLASDAYPAILKIIDVFIEDYRRSVLQYDLKDLSGPSMQEFALLKATQHGAESLALKLKQLKHTLKK